MRVVAFESRRAREMEKLISRLGGVPIAAPSMREIPLERIEAPVTFAKELQAGRVDVLVLLTGVGTRMLVQLASRHLDQEELMAALRRVAKVARGPKPVAALKELGLTPDLTVPEPNTWRDLVAALRENLPVEGKRVVVQEYGQPNPDLVAALEQAGAEVSTVAIYRWGLPEDLTPLRRAIAAIAEGNADVALFTSAQQVRHLFQVAAEEGKEAPLRDGLCTVLIGSIGPTTTAALRAAGLVPDYEPDSPKMANLVRETARRAHPLLRKKRTAAAQGVDTNRWRRVEMVWPIKGEGDGRRAAAGQGRFLRACRREATDTTPVWLMRQAGRFLREYRQIRERVSFLELCRTPELAAEVTLMAVDRLGVDAAIIFADILLILPPMGVDLTFSKRDGPVIHQAVRQVQAISKLRAAPPEELSFVYEAIKLTRAALDPSIALIGFAGAPFTVASYAIEGGSSRTFRATKELMYRHPEAWHHLMDLLVRGTAGYLNEQFRAGADVLQLFDSWVGCLSPDDYRELVVPHMKALFAALDPGAVVIHFGTGTAALLELQRDAGGDVIGVDWREDLARAWRRIGYDRAVQGNLDPLALFAPREVLRRQVKRILTKAEGRPGHIFNLGHGILPGTPVDNVLALVDMVHEMGERASSAADG